jgi:hypothetical protein
MHNYVRVVGRLDVYNNTTELRVTHIRPVLDMHEPFFHLLDAMVASLSRQRVLVVNFWGIARKSDTGLCVALSLASCAYCTWCEGTAIFASYAASFSRYRRSCS